MRIVVAGDFSFPVGGAALARVANIAAAAAEAGVEVHVVALSGAGRGSEFGPVAATRFGELPVSAFAWSRPPQAVGASRLRWLWDTYAKTPAGLRWYFSRHPLRQSDVVFVYGRSYFRLRRLFSVAQACGAFSVLDVTEGLERFAGFGGRINPVYRDWALGLKHLPGRANLVTAISNGLVERAKAARADWVMLMPGIEEWTPPPIFGSNSSHGFRLLVFGSLLPKDDPGLLAGVAGELARRQIPISIELVGRYGESPVGRRWAEEIRARAGDQVVVRSRGAPTSEELPAVLAEADAFLMLRPDTTAERLAFPTRLVELLKIGRPLFVSDVGDVSTYLKHREHALLLRPGSVVNAVDTIEEVLRQQDRGRKIGLGGWMQGQRCFNRATRVESLLEAIRGARLAGPVGPIGKEAV